MKVINQHSNSLIEKCKNGDTSAQFAIYKQYYKAMYNTSFRIVNDCYEAEDIMQESFLSAFTKLHSFSETVTFGAWLKRIVINKSINATEINVEIQENNNLNVKAILAALKTLKNNYKIALTLHLIEGYDYEEIAQIMDISYENSRTTISRAKNKLRHLLSCKNERQYR